MPVSDDLATPRATNLLKQAVEVDMHNVSCVGIQKYVLAMPIAKSAAIHTLATAQRAKKGIPKNKPNHGHDRRRPSIGHSTCQPCTGFWERLQEPLVKYRWESTCHIIVIQDMD